MDLEVLHFHRNALAPAERLKQGFCESDLTVPVAGWGRPFPQPVQTHVQSVLDPVLGARGVLHHGCSGSAQGQEIELGVIFIIWKYIDTCYVSLVQVHIVLRGLLEGVQTPVRYENQLINCDNQMLLGKGHIQLQPKGNRTEKSCRWRLQHCDSFGVKRWWKQPRRTRSGHPEPLMQVWQLILRMNWRCKHREIGRQVMDIQEFTLKQSGQTKIKYQSGQNSDKQT